MQKPKTLIRWICVFWLCLAPFHLAAKHHQRIKAEALIDLSTKKLLSSRRADARIRPASLTKLMTLYIAFDSLKKGKIRMDDLFTVSQAASSAPPLKLGLKQGEKVKVRDLLSAVAVYSANDAARTLAENIAGSEESFAKLMNATAKKLHMSRTKLYNASGLYHEKQLSTVRDLSKLAMGVLSFKEHRHIFSATTFSFKGKAYNTTNTLLSTLPGSYGLKTGYIKASGYNLIMVCKRGNRDLMGIVIGEDSPHARANKMTTILEQGFGRFALKDSKMASSGKQARNGIAPDLSGPKATSESRQASDNISLALKSSEVVSKAKRVPGNTSASNGARVAPEAKQAPGNTLALKGAKVAPKAKRAPGNAPASNGADVVSESKQASVSVSPILKSPKVAPKAKRVPGNTSASNGARVAPEAKQVPGNTSASNGARVAPEAKQVPGDTSAPNGADVVSGSKQASGSVSPILKSPKVAPKAKRAPGNAPALKGAKVAPKAKRAPGSVSPILKSPKVTPKVKQLPRSAMQGKEIQQNVIAFPFPLNRKHLHIAKVASLPSCP